MIQRFQIRSCAVLVAIAFAGCVPGDSGGGGGLGSFNRGFAFVRSGNIYVADNSAYQNPIQLTTSGDDQYPSLSRDRRVVYVRGGNQLWVVPASNSPSPAQVLVNTGGGTNLRTPVFSPDGNSIVFAYNLGGAFQLGKVNVDGTGFQQLTSQFYYIGPSFFSDGSGVLAARATSPPSQYNQIVQVPVNPGRDSLITNALGPDACSVENRVALSPDGSKLAFDARTVASSGACSGTTRIFIMDMIGSRMVRRVTDSTDPSVRESFPSWVGNDQVGFSSNFGGADQVYVLPANAAPTSGGLKVPTASQPYYGPN
jgi:Tol biopolymer transport system component